jgi:hypothetical protein
VLADGRLARPVLPCRGGAHDRHEFRARAIRSSEIAPREQRDSQRGQIPRSDDVPARLEERLSVRRLDARHGDAAETALPSKWQQRRNARRVDTWVRANALEQLLHGERPCRARVARKRQLEGRDLDPSSVETEVDRTRSVQRPREQTRADHEQDADGNLRDDEGAAKPQPGRSSL